MPDGAPSTWNLRYDEMQRELDNSNFSYTNMGLHIPPEESLRASLKQEFLHVRQILENCTTTRAFYRLTL